MCPAFPYYTRESVSDYPLTPQGKDPNGIMGVASRAQSLGLLETGRVFLGSPVRGWCQSGCWESVWSGHALKPVSSIPESACVALSSAGIKMQVGENRKKRKIFLMIQGRAGRIPEGGVIVFPVGEVSSFQGKCLLGRGVLPGLPLQTLLLTLQAVLPSLRPAPGE